MSLSLKAGRNKKLIKAVVIVIIIIVIFIVYLKLNNKGDDLGDNSKQSSRSLSPTAAAFKEIERKQLDMNFFSNSKYRSLQEIIIKRPEPEVGKENIFRFNNFTEEKAVENNLNSNE